MQMPNLVMDAREEIVRPIHYPPGYAGWRCRYRLDLACSRTVTGPDAEGAAALLGGSLMQAYGDGPVRADVASWALADVDIALGSELDGGALELPSRVRTGTTLGDDPMNAVGNAFNRIMQQFMWQTLATEQTKRPAIDAAALVEIGDDDPAWIVSYTLALSGQQWIHARDADHARTLLAEDVDAIFGPDSLSPISWYENARTYAIESVVPADADVAEAA